MTRFGLLLPPLSGPAAGLRVYVEQLAPRLLSLHQDWVIFTEDELAPPSWCNVAMLVRIGRGVAVRIAGRTVHARLARFLAIQTALRRELRRRGVGALLVPFHDGVLRCPVPQVITVHDLTFVRRRLPGSRLARLYMQTVVRAAVRSSAAVIAVSASTRDDLLRCWRLDRRCVHVVHEGYDRSIFRTFGDEDVRPVLARHGIERPYVFYAGTLMAHKNLVTVVDALATIGDRWPDLTLQIAGPARPEHAAELVHYATGQGLRGRVNLLGYVAREELGPLMAAAAAFVFPSLHEGFGLAPLEAMASGGAVLASDRASLPEVVGAGGKLLDPREPKAWAEAISELLERREHSQALRQAAIEQAARFDWDRAAEQTLRLLREVSQRASGHGYS